MKAPNSVVLVQIDAWEIECCAPPPAVGELTEWRLYFMAAGPDPALNFTADWTASPWPPDAPDQLGIVLRCGQLTVLWADPPEPITGLQRLTGQVYGTRHGGTDTDLFPMTAAVVRRVRVVRHMVQDVDRVISPVPGSLTLADVPVSPRWFHRGRKGATGEPTWSQDGVLLDLAMNPGQAELASYQDTVR